MEHRYHILRCVDAVGKIVAVYVPRDKQGFRMPGVETIKGCLVSAGLLAKLITDKYQFHLPVERQVACLKMMGMDISKCMLNFWLQKAVGKLTKLMPFLKASLLAQGSHLFCDKTSEMVCMKDTLTKEFDYRKKYVWDWVNPIQKCVYYLYEAGSRSRNIAFMNELAKIFNAMGIDTNDVIEVASTKWNFIKLKPGLVGGHCISVDPSSTK